MRRLIASLLVASCAGAAAAHAESAAVNYMLHCQGCHLADGSGKPGAVPALGEAVPRLASLPAGRVYLMRVPGASQSSLSDAELAAVLNYIVQRYGAGDEAAHRSHQRQIADLVERFEEAAEEHAGDHGAAYLLACLVMDSTLRPNYKLDYLAT